MPSSCPTTAGPQLHAGGLELRGHRGAHLVAEEGERGVLRRDHRHLDVVVAHRERLTGRHQRELVRRQRPDGARRDHDRDPLHVALVEVAQQAAVELGIAAGPPRRRALDARHGTAAGRHDQLVVVQRGPAREPGAAEAVVDLLERVDEQLRSGLLREARERHLVRVTETERLGHGERLVRELGVWGDEREAGALSGHLTDGEERFQPGDAAAGDDDVHASSLGARRDRCRPQLPARPAPWFPADRRQRRRGSHG